MKLTKIQGLPTSGARSVELFRIEQTLYAALPQLAEDIEGSLANMNGGNSDTKASIFCWQNGAFQPFQELSVHGGEHIAFGLIEQRPYLAIANIRKGQMPNFETNVPSQVFCWNGERFELSQLIDSIAAKSTCFMNIEGQSLLLISEGVLESENDKEKTFFNRLYRWQNNTFNLMQSLPSVWGYDASTFSFNQQHFLAIGDNVQSSRLYKWQNNQFELVESFAEHGGGRGFCYFSIAGEHYLAFANLLDESVLYKWDGKRFSEYQKFKAPGTRSFHHAKLNGNHYLFKTNFITGKRERPISKQDSQIFKWQEGQFIQVAEYPTFGGTEAKTFSEEGNHYLVVANSLSEDIRFRVDSVVYKLSL